MPLNQDINNGLTAVETTLDRHLAIEAGKMSAIIAAEVAILEEAGLEEAAIVALITADLQPGGRLYSQMNTATRSRIFQSFQNASFVGEHAVYREAGFGGQPLRWVNINGGNVCPDCESRQGQVAPAEEWQAVGMPGSGWSVCRHNCQCRLVPVTLDVPDRVVVET